MYTVSRGMPILGVELDKKGANFGIFSDCARYMILTIYLSSKEDWPLCKLKLDREEKATGDIFHVYIEGIREKMAYTWEMINEKGEILPIKIDPYAYCIQSDDTHQIYKNIIMKKTYCKTLNPSIPWNETILYELHVGHFTKHNSSNVVEEERGTFRGLIKKLDYLKALGVTTLELLPVFKWNRFTIKNVNPTTGEILKDVWGYNPISFFCLDEAYSVEKDGLSVREEFIELVEKAHEKHLEIILDVVYNHTGEGGDKGSTFNFKALAPEIYYKRNEKGEYLNCSGTGNTFNTNHSVTKKLILDSLKYWVINMGVDGFRFDLASILGQDQNGRWMNHSLLNDISEDPILSHVKIISESWDAKGSYDVGRMPYYFREWSDYFRDTVRKFIRGDQGLTRSIADCLLGKEIYFSDSSKEDTHAIHFITAHDGFTMWDLLCYETKHNFENGEDNRDGHNANYSVNCGFEGETDSISIVNMRKRRMKNYMCLLFLSKGVPMLLMGDEIARSQKGNNNAFCQDNENVWLNWERGEEFKDLFLFTKGLIAIRHKVYYFKESLGKNYTISWHGVCYNKPDWSYYSRSIACHLKSEKESIYIIMNSYNEALTFDFPPTSTVWLRVLDTNLKTPEDINEEGLAISHNRYLVECFSICLFREKITN